MKPETPEENAYLLQLHTATQGDIKTQVSMYDVGTALGLEKAAAGSLAESLFIQGFAELKTLSGGIGITVQGLRALDMPVPGDEDNPDLGTGPVLEAGGREAAEKLLREIRDSMGRATASFSRLEELVLDIKTMEVQLLSPAPKTAIIREIFRSLHGNLTNTAPQALTRKLSSVISM